MKNRTIKAVCATAALSGLAVAPLATAVAEEVRVPVMSQAERGAQDSDRQQIARHVMRWQIRQRQKE